MNPTKVRLAIIAAAYVAFEAATLTKAHRDARKSSEELDEVHTTVTNIFFNEAKRANAKVEFLLIKLEENGVMLDEFDRIAFNNLPLDTE